MAPRPSKKLLPISERKNKVHVADFATPVDLGQPSLTELFPHILAGGELAEFIDCVLEARRLGRPIIFMMGAHVLKVGLGPLLIQLMNNGLLTHLATNGAAAIHDYEIALIGATSEDVAENLETGRFGNWEETSQLNTIITQAAKDGLGFGKAVGREITTKPLPYHEYSVFGAAYKKQIPATVHTAIGTEIIHQHPNADGAAIGQTSLHDFHVMIKTVSNLEGGVVMNWGSSVIMPEVFLKALTVARYNDGKAGSFTAADFDMIRAYRPLMNVVNRPTKHGGRGFTFLGHHEIMLPIVVRYLLEKI